MKILNLLLKKLSVLMVIVLIGAAALILPSKLIETPSKDDVTSKDNASYYSEAAYTADRTKWEEIAHVVANTGAYYKGGLYTDNYTKLVKWPVLSDEEIEQYDIERKSHPLHYYTDKVHLYPENFHPNLKVIGAEAFAGNLQVVQVVIPWGVEEIQARAFEGCSMSIYIPDTTIRISSDNDDSATIGTYLTYNYSSTNNVARTALNYNPMYIDDHVQKWRAAYGITVQRWQLLNGRIYCFSGNSESRLVTGTQNINGIIYHLSDTGELLSAELPEGDYELSTFGIHVDDNGNVTVTTAYNPNNKIIPGVVYGDHKSSLVNNWKIDAGFLYYFGADLYSVIKPISRMLTGTQEINGITYHFAESGELLSAELPEGDYKLDYVNLHVDDKGNVTIKQ